MIKFFLHLNLSIFLLLIGFTIIINLIYIIIKYFIINIDYKMISKIKLNSNDLFHCLITVLSILLFNHRKYTFEFLYILQELQFLSFSFKI